MGLARITVVVIGVLLSAAATFGAPSAQPIGPGLYAYISDNDSSANATFLVGEKAILVVDTGLNEVEGRKLLKTIRAVSTLPIKYVVNTHYHPDHQGGNATVGPDAIVITTDFTRDRTLAVNNSPAMANFHLHPAQLTFEKQLTLHIDPYVAQVFFSGKAHTSGDAMEDITHDLRSNIRNENDHLASGIPPYNLPGGFQPVHLWHLGVEQNDIGLHTRDLVECVLPVSRLATNLPPRVEGQECADHAPHTFVIVGQKDSKRGHGPGIGGVRQASGASSQHIMHDSLASGNILSEFQHRQDNW